MNTVDYVIYAFLAINITFNLLGSIALHRFPDVYTRLHGATKCTTFGTIFAVLAVVVHSLYRLDVTGDPKYLQMTLHSVVALIALLLTNPTGAHAIAKAAHLSGVKPVKAVIDAYEGKLGGGEE
ncbi:membrane bound hydrogenase, MbhC subunit [Thermococcus onnurineus NA1]|uniref:Membrane bound hydrogenase, MbhC subunit n=1 Tax=Thermococcus onnurineus (strain NA1) TaxID=523850 RepID=B6YTY3_THEON|nr:MULTISPECIES: monovalent cation/H(+) antiporter subunit G [Thermococcus]ACJ17074.1 membrane bound hydrogenase, MbhC subunit [Thermococcus onnurineus NA1]NJE43154.1 cation:proton antiporter [Thermococcus sp. GR6]NJE46200.1 cation:proton antiporter [Thermococcus sp. GR7]NJE79391.1 cation:proton antiporter [Thermococcus sp. GR4]NJF23995.1 cation:proton antiporter [Thermococcus sp. GR5]